MSVPKVTSPSEKVQAAPRAGVAMAVIMTGVLMTPNVPGGASTCPA